MEHQDGSTHIVSVRANILVWVVLLLFTGLTVLVADIDLGRADILINILIASVKAWLIVYVFMHMKYESLLLKLMLLLTIGTLTVIIMLTFLDTLYR